MVHTLPCAVLVSLRMLLRAEVINPDLFLSKGSYETLEKDVRFETVIPRQYRSDTECVHPVEF